MPDQFTAGTCLAILLLTWAYSLGLRRIRTTYIPRWTWATVVAGVTLVGLVVAARLFLLPLPAYQGELLAAWVWWQWVWHFVAGGLPIIWWQLDEDRRALETALKADRPRKEPPQ
jgi:hypothetical protein